MKKDQIIYAIAEGLPVNWKPGYEVIDGGKAGILVRCVGNGHCGGLFKDNGELVTGYKESEFSIAPAGIEIKIAREFCKNLREYLKPGELEEAARLNKEEGADVSDQVCHSHDHCDANVFMGEAFETVTGREPSPNSDADCDLWNAAWARAKRAGFKL